MSRAARPARRGRRSDAPAAGAAGAPSVLVEEQRHRLGCGSPRRLVGLGIARIDELEVMHEDPPDRGAGHPLVVGRYRVPRRVGGARGAQGRLVGLPIRGPVRRARCSGRTSRRASRMPRGGAPRPRSSCSARPRSARRGRARGRCPRWRGARGAPARRSPPRSAIGRRCRCARARAARGRSARASRGPAPAGWAA
jgi:hypothetical protein